MKRIKKLFKKLKWFHGNCQWFVYPLFVHLTSHFISQCTQNIYAMKLFILPNEKEKSHEISKNLMKMDSHKNWFIGLLPFKSNKFDEWMRKWMKIECDKIKKRAQTFSLKILLWLLFDSALMSLMSLMSLMRLMAKENRTHFLHSQ